MFHNNRPTESKENTKSFDAKTGMRRSVETSLMKTVRKLVAICEEQPGMTVATQQELIQQFWDLLASENNYGSIDDCLAIVDHARAPYLQYVSNMKDASKLGHGVMSCLITACAPQTALAANIFSFFCLNNIGGAVINVLESDDPVNTRLITKYTKNDLFESLRNVLACKIDFVNYDETTRDRINSAILTIAKISIETFKIGNTGTTFKEFNEAMTARIKTVVEQYASQKSRHPADEKESTHDRTDGLRQRYR